MTQTYQDKPHPTTQHPLMGARLELLLTLAVANGGVTPKVFPLFLLMLLSGLARLPFRVLDEFTFQTRKRQQSIDTPVFIIGHWRSGTTHLHNLLGKAPHFAHISPTASGIPDELLTIGQWFKPLINKALPEDRHVDKVAVTPESPQEDEIPLASMQSLSIYHGLYFPSQFEKAMHEGVFLEGVSKARLEKRKRTMKRFLAKIACQQGKACVLVKNPVYTAQVSYLRDIWPDCKIIYIHRDPYRVFQSTRHYYRKLLPDLALQPFDHLDLSQFIIDKYVKVMKAYREDPFDRSPENFTEVIYEELADKPMAIIQALYKQLDLPGWGQAQPAIETYLNTVSDYTSKHMNQLSLSDEDKALVDEALNTLSRDQ